MPKETKTQDEKQRLTQAEIAQEKLKEELLSQIRGVSSPESLQSLQRTLATASVVNQEVGEDQGKLINQEGYIIANNQEEFVRAIFFNTKLNSAQKIELLIELDDIISNKDLIFNSIFNELNNENQLTEKNKELLIELFKIGYQASSQSIKDNTTYQSLTSRAVRQLEKETDGIINTSRDLDPNQDIKQERLNGLTREALIKISVLGYCYANGEGVAKDLSEAARLYKLAAKQGNANAQANLGFCYYSGEGVVEDLSKAVELSTLAANQGHAAAQSNLGFCYYSGEGVVKDLSKTVEFYTLAANQGNASAQSNLGYCYEKGEGVAKDFSKAVRLYKLAANQGNARAQNNLKLLTERDQKAFVQIEAGLNKIISNFINELNFKTDEEVQGFIDTQLADLVVKQKEKVRTINLKEKFFTIFIAKSVNKIGGSDLSPKQQEARLDNILHIAKTKTSNQECANILQDAVVKVYHNFVYNYPIVEYFKNHLDQYIVADDVKGALQDPNVNTQVPTVLTGIIGDYVGLPSTEIQVRGDEKERVERLNKGSAKGKDDCVIS